ncbi:hypothetical protein SAMD00019534_114810 [Acytostelium subglobosum LB1]|uniref:hypothetical protein n=1 Tax=Acytostelium subglobosum LB1 TaxID=1410327 RepID=UPI0006448DB4|nr:hypothetical protein SAMD00019534_114810 [Acytostelium subglobosum LB1]GAM28305.1 hypothetical protein SAMD00019534_114810 [Acytostelium subglobosum LB1]|eukprot:XP_012748622.1 hypothetical protein SAMD00019534_114810 [Acytostelium subglobosum LB1]
MMKEKEKQSSSSTATKSTKSKDASSTSSTLKRKKTDDTVSSTTTTTATVANTTTATSTASTNKKQKNSTTSVNATPALPIDNAPTWDGTTAIESLTVGELIESLKGKQINLRIQVAEYLLEHRIAGLSEKSGHLLMWAMDVVLKTYSNYRSRALEGVSDPLCYQVRYWSLIKRIIEKIDVASTNVQLTSEHLVSFLEFIFNAMSNFVKSPAPLAVATATSTSASASTSNAMDTNGDANSGTTSSSSSSNNKKLKKFQVSSSPPPPLALIPLASDIIKHALPLFLAVDILREMPLFFEAIHPLLIHAIRKHQQDEQLIVIFGLVRHLLEYLVHQVQVRSNSRHLQTIVLNLLPYLLTYRHSIQCLLARANTQTEPAAATAHGLTIGCIDQLLQWALFHPDSHWASYTTILFQGWIAEVEQPKTPSKKSKDSGYLSSSQSTTPTATSPTSSSLNSSTSGTSTKGKESSADSNAASSLFQGQAILDRFQQIITNKESLSPATYDDAPLENVVLGCLPQLLRLFAVQLSQYGIRHITDFAKYDNDSTLTELKKVQLLEFAFFRKLFLMFLSGGYSPKFNQALINKHPSSYFSAMSALLATLSDMNIFYQDNDNQMRFLQLQLEVTVRIVSQPKAPVEQMSGALQLLASFAKISHVIVDPHLHTIFHSLLSSPQQAQGTTSTVQAHSDNLLHTLFDTYLAIRQSDNLIDKLNKTIISGKLRSMCIDKLTNRRVLDKLATHFAALPFGQVPLIWNQFFDVWRDYFSLQINEGDDIRDPLLIERLTCFASIWSTFLDNIQMTTFVTQKLEKQLDQTFSLIVDPLLNTIAKAKGKSSSSSKSSSKSSKSKDTPSKSSSKSKDVEIDTGMDSSNYSQLHSFVHRLSIAKDTEGANKYNYHRQQFTYYQRYETELEPSKILGYLITLFDGDSQTSGITTDLQTTILTLAISRVQQLNSLLQSVPNHQAEKVTAKKISSVHLSSLEHHAPSDITKEMQFIVYKVLERLKSNTELEHMWKLVLDNICIWCDYATPKHIQYVLTKMIRQGGVNPSSQTQAQSLFTNVLTNSQFYEIESFREQFPTMLAKEVQRAVEHLITGSKTQKKMATLFSAIGENLSGHDDCQSFSEIVQLITSTLKSLELSAKDLLQDQDVWNHLAWLLALIPAMNASYIQVDCVGTLTLLPVIIDIVISAIELDDGNDKAFTEMVYRALLANRKLLKYCLQKDQSRLVQIIPLSIWISIVFNNSKSTASFEHVVDNVGLITHHLNDIQHIIASELWEKHPMDFTELTELAMKENKHSSKDSFGSGGVGIILKSIVDSVENGFKKSLPSDLEEQLQCLDKPVHKFIDELVVTPKDGLAAILSKRRDQLETTVYYLWLSISKADPSTMSRVERLDITPEEADTVIKLARAIGPFISNLNPQNIAKVPITLQTSIVSLLDLCSKISANIILQRKNNGTDATSSDTRNTTLQESSYLVSLHLYLIGLYPVQSKLSKQLSNSLLHFGQHNQIDNFMPMLVQLLSNEHLKEQQFQVLHIINLLINSGTRQMLPAVLSSLIETCVSVVYSCVSHSEPHTQHPLLNNALMLLAKLADRVNPQQSGGEAMQTIMTIFLAFEGPFVYSVPRSLKSYQAEQSYDTLPMEVVDFQIVAASQSQTSHPTRHIKMDSELFTNLCRLLYSVQRSKGKHFVKLISPFINCLRYLLFGLANDDYGLDDRCARSLSRLLEDFSKFKDAKNYLHHIILDYINILTYQPSAATASVASSTSTSSTSSISSTTTSTSNNKHPEHQQQRHKLKQVQYYLTIDIRRSLQPGLIAVFGSIDNTMRESLFKSLGDESKGHFKTLYEQHQSERYTGK